MNPSTTAAEAASPGPCLVAVT